MSVIREFEPLFLILSYRDLSGRAGMGLGPGLIARALNWTHQRKGISNHIGAIIKSTTYTKAFDPHKELLWALCSLNCYSLVHIYRALRKLEASGAAGKDL